MTGQFHRFTPEAFELIGRMDGRQSLQEIWDAACAKLGDLMPTQREVIGLLSQLHQANVIQGDRAADIAEMEGRSRRLKRQRIVQKLMSPLGVRLPLFDPEKFLERTQKYVTPVFTRWGFLAWLALVGAALVLAVVHWGDLSRNVSDRVLQIENVLLMALVYPVVKTIHELGHAYAVKRWGGEVHEIGVMFLVFYPVPYVDASAATAFRSKWERMAVGAAGIMVEMLLAALALFAWLNVGPGTGAGGGGRCDDHLRHLHPPVQRKSPAAVRCLLCAVRPGSRFPTSPRVAPSEVGYLVKRHLFSALAVADAPRLVEGRKAAWLTGYAVSCLSPIA